MHFKYNSNSAASDLFVYTSDVAKQANVNTTLTYQYIALARSHTSLNAEVTPKRYAPWLAKQRKLVQ